MKRFGILAVAGAVFMLQGCDADSIDQVKSLSAGESSLGQAFEARTDCVQGAWRSFEDAGGRDVVLYSCKLPAPELAELTDKFRMHSNQMVEQNTTSRWRAAHRDDVARVMSEMSIRDVELLYVWRIKDGAEPHLADVEVKAATTFSSFSYSVSQPDAFVALAYRAPLPDLWPQSLFPQLDKNAGALYRQLSTH
ncbi:hypothetical protein G9X43_06420 [Cronobacter turicensis]|uniref:hypothetical protein n=1 Tax=Cronobacter turicensis TaxID=413502 RepID=UPI001411C635|nr:hypothetical protein [Cronobacter turicensis]NHV08573.1 hypothetical protein [Cronobacter turicensis]NHV62541.1 hypothetical protein [Cronobacter turicensis]NHW09482.1 hypothetical protein [Cronobacter turicensis]